MACVPVVASATVYPSGGDFARRSVPIAAPAPAMFSTTTGWPSSSASFAATGRDNESVGPPGGKGTIHFSGLDGYCPNADVATTSRTKRNLCIHASGFGIDEIERRFAGEHAQHLLGGADPHARARFRGHPGKVRREDHVVQR